MEKLPMCRICLVKNVNMYVVVNKNLHELYEKLTDIPFVTTDSRPILTCFFCCAKLKQCFRFVRKCLEAEELFTQMMNGDYEPNPSISQDDLHCCTGFIRSPTVHVSIVDECETDSFAIKEEVPAICERQDDVIEPNEEYQSDDVDLENLNNTCLGTEDTPHMSESDSGGDVKIEEEEEQELSKKKRRAVETNRAPVTKKPKLDTRRTNLEDAITVVGLKKNEQLNLTAHNQIHTGEKRSRRQANINIGARANIIALHKSGLNKTQIAEETGLSRNTVSLWIKRYEGEGSLTSRQRSGRPSHISGAQRRHMVGEYETHGFTPTRHFAELFHTSSQTVRRALHAEGLRHRRPAKKPRNPYQCDVCQRSFSKKCTLTKHIQIHTGEKPYQCDVCERSYSRKSHLTTHIRLHTGEKPYQCDVCQRSFSMKCSLAKHIRIHTGKKPYQCDVCQRSFSMKCTLTVHIRIHTGEKPY